MIGLTLYNNWIEEVRINASTNIIEYIHRISLDVIDG